MSPATKSDSTRRERFLIAVRECAKRDGKVPGIRRFAKEMGEDRHTWQGLLWPTWGAFLREAGFEPGELTQSIPKDELLRSLAILTREHGRFPPNEHLKFAHRNHPALASEKTFRKRLGRQHEMVAALSEWVEDKPEYKDVKLILASTPMRAIAPAKITAEAGIPIERMADSFVPPIIDCLPALASGEPSIERLCAIRGADMNVEFEGRVAIAFRILGLDVESLGQGAGRVADGIARCTPKRWAVVYDAKVRRGGFVMGTEDRKFREYIDRHGSDLAREGIDSVYFAVVSSSFNQGDIVKAREVVRLTKAKALVLLEAAALRALVELKLRTTTLMDWVVLERAFAVSGIITPDDVAKMEKQ